jgi:hypothetical protein
MKSKTLIISVLLMTLFFSCKKEEGIGGDASIIGNVLVRDYNTNFTQLIGVYPAEDVYVYLVFGDHNGYDRRIKTDYNGNFFFKYLYPGDYKVYVYSTDSTFTDVNNFVAVVKDLHIKDRKEEVDLGTITITD